MSPAPLWSTPASWISTAMLIGHLPNYPFPYHCTGRTVPYLTSSRYCWLLCVCKSVF
jgi:hypothetical protein